MRKKAKRHLCADYLSYVETEKKKIITRLRRIEGQVRGLQNMVENDVYCIDVITQTSAVRSALRAVEDVLLEGHLKTCAKHQLQSGKKEDEDKVVQEMLKVYKLKK